MFGISYTTIPNVHILGYSLACPQTNIRRAGYAKVPKVVLEIWAPTKQVICLVELAAVLTLLHHEHHHLAGTDLMLFVDNSAAVSAFVKGRSGSADLDRLAQQIHLISYEIDVRIWIEYIETDANWADGVSRRGPDCHWARKHGFQVRTVEVPQLHRE